ncbi:pilus assembly protein PilO [Bacillus taeanensis]|uniref:Pilus assembly protein PilO n=1 Tax=Bacillus taeanensis TaxID=273032 RepID=A0A366Y5V4_9BACI|nr:pilus assembly protein PilO [Bacillus taeanensis]RBW71591.1 pilus assembly protein PilO [Bacillus taeanensis]
MKRLIEMAPHYLLIIIIFFMLLILGSGYAAFLLPAKQELEKAEKNFQHASSQLALLEAQQLEQNAFNYESAIQLQKEVPVQPLVDQFILQLEKAEVISDSLIRSMIFSEGDALLEDEENQVIPEDVKRITVQLNMASKGYSNLMRFLEEIESLERITKIDSLNFSGNREILSIDEEVDQINYSVQVSTFYIPGLEELLNDLPSVEYPAPADKNNPLYHGGSRDDPS